MQKELNRSSCRFGLWARMGRRNRVLDEDLEVLRDVAMATNFGQKLLVTGFVGFKFGCMIASDMLFDSMGGFFGVKLSSEDIADFEFLRLSSYGVHVGATWSIRMNRACAMAMWP